MTEENEKKSKDNQLVLDLPVETAMGEADFVVSESNKLAYNHLLGESQWPSNVTVLWGPAKSGKSHLAGVWADKADAATATRDGGWEDYLETDTLVEEADELWMGETELFNLLNQAMRTKFKLLLTASAHPNDWPLSTNDVRSRLRLAYSVEIAALDDAHLMQLIVKLFDDRQVQIDPSLISYILPRMERSPAQVITLVEKMDELALSRGKPITKRLAADALEELTKS